ncbi:MAG: hypothetical protein F6K09_08535 [Merismopedia sp. SIO2A8]|nr:hypothetical protein [Symploca sp. SIO2B6]NET48757.1 hypothetical protein [Merismopedia sp. SIO2A8]
MMVQDFWLAIATKSLCWIPLQLPWWLPWWKILAALGGSVLVTAIAFGILVWMEQRHNV